MGTMKSELRKVRDLQKVSVEKSPDDYSVGIYNGLELALSIMEKREPAFVFPESDKDAMVVEGQEEEKPAGRTVASGKRVIRNV